jgi:hypothetical protein
MAEAGRPKSERQTRAARMYEDTADMLSWVLRLEGNGESVADFLETQNRSEVERRFAPLAKRVATIKAALSGKGTKRVRANEGNSAGSQRR